jgi:hypothetical protein
MGGAVLAGPLSLAADAQELSNPAFRHARGQTQWVQYTFPDEEEVASIELFWVATPGAPNPASPPESWRLLYQDGGQWKEVSARDPHATAANTFTTLRFEPVKTLAMRVEATMAGDTTVGLAEWRVGPPPVLVPSSDLTVNQTFELDGDALDWTITLANATDRGIEIGDLALPFQFAERTGARGDIYTRKLLRHAYVAGHGSWVYWQRAGGEGPYLVMTPIGAAKFEYYDSSGGAAEGFGAYTPYIHAGTASAAARRQAATGGCR